MTTRERREARAARLRGWAEKREASGEARIETAHQLGAGIPFGQPILIGHHSEKRHRGTIARIDSNMRAGIDDTRKAADMESRADNIEKATANSIFTDDHDAAEKLTEKIARLTAQRDRMKERNAEFRKEHKAELKELTGYERDRALPHQSYEITNLTANIGRLSKRLKGLDGARARQAAGRIIMARFAGACAECGAAIEKNQTIRYSRQDGARCAPACGEEG